MSNYLGGPQGELYYSLAANLTKNTWTAEALVSAPATGSVPRCFIPGGYFNQVGKSAHFEANGTVTATATSVTFTYVAALDSTAGTKGSTIVSTATLAVGTAAVQIPWTIEGDIVAQAVGASGTSLQCNGEVDVGTNVSATWITARNTAMYDTLLTGLNNEVNQYLELFSACSVSSASNQLVVKQLKLYLEN